MKNYKKMNNGYNRNQCDPYAMCRQLCNPCPGPPKPPPARANYFYVERTASRDSSERASSTGSTKSVPSQKRSNGSFSKSTSDSKVAKKGKKAKKGTKNGEGKNGKIDPEGVQQLRSDLNTIKEQLSFLAKNRNQALEVTNQLQERFNELVKKSRDQEKQIEELKNENKNLVKKITKGQGGEGVEEALAAKKNLDLYENKLNILYGELLSSSKAMEEGRKKICHCIKKKDDEFKEIDKASKKTSEEYKNLEKRYQQTKENEQRLVKEKEDLISSVKRLEQQLGDSVKQLEVLRNEGEMVARKQQQEIQSLNSFYACDVEAKNRKIEELNHTLCECSKQMENYQKTDFEYNQLRKEHEQLVLKLQNYEKVNYQRFQELQRLRKNEKSVLDQLNQMQNYVNQIMQISDKQKMVIAELQDRNQAKDKTIQCQKAELASKAKQIEILMKSEDRLKKRTIELQEEMVGMRISQPQGHSRILTAEESPNLSEELQDLIAALYEEIDRAASKDEELEGKNRKISYLECAVADKDKELIRVRNELKILRDRFATGFKAPSSSNQTESEEDCDDNCECT